MRTLPLVLYLQLIFIWESSESISCDVNSKNTEARLQQQLLCSYDKSIRPVGNSKNRTTVKVKMFVKSFEYDDVEGKLTINSWLSLRWTDEHLKWNAKDFDNIGTTNIHSDDIWMPDLALYNSKTTQFSETCTSSHCIVYSNGAVSCIPPCSHEAICRSNYKYWPFDTQNCSLHLGSWVHKGEEIDYQTLMSGIERSKLQHNEWKIVNTYVKKNPGNYSCCPDETYPSLHYTFIIERHSASEQAFILAPAMILVALNLISLWLSPTCSERIIICIVSLFSHFIFIQQLSWLVPKNGEIVPNAILFFRDSLVISAVLILNTVILRGLLSTEATTPIWVKNLTESLKNNTIGNAVFSKPYLINRTPLNNDSGADDASNLIEGGGAETVAQAAANNKTEDSTSIWVTTVRIIDILLFIILLVVYFFMLVSWIPEEYEFKGKINAELLDDD
ncbi:unnamed protein product [Hermetia illucens]|uniref:Neurotransmitter-gated ion-channel ligand-binding domain-containing protein n=1 Tax=Hermetia illucens TaxID=343691 RepID=A0A7R8USG0_HERIL|nr:neuronal acetylcholine receptor subunit alpha-2-like [Hermetia illucens]XP_037910825.1 neuronal acetylcholine receptor subunit alpha-2-like [Hermetia illucens]CAD7086208.1 unnamed protein product [Hermetia illucens]